MRRLVWGLGVSCCIAVGLWWWLSAPAPNQSSQPMPVSAAQPTSVSQTPATTPPAPTVSPTSRSLPTHSLAPAAPTTPAQHAEWQRELIDGLIVMNDADSSLAAALILHALYPGDTKEMNRARMLLTSAQKAAPADRAIAAAALRMCRAMPNCDSGAYQGALSKLDPQNELAVIDDALNALDTGTEDAKREALKRLVGRRLNLYHAELAFRVARAITRIPISPRVSPDMAELYRLQSELTQQSIDALAVPGYSALIALCQTGAWQVRQVCLDTQMDLRQSELFELQSVALALQRVDTRNPRVNRPASDAESYLNWLRGSLANVPPPAGDWIDLLARNRTEMDAARAWLEINGIELRTTPVEFKR